MGAGIGENKVENNSIKIRSSVLKVGNTLTLKDNDVYIVVKRTEIINDFDGGSVSQAECLLVTKDYYIKECERNGRYFATNKDGFLK